MNTITLKYNTTQIISIDDRYSILYPTLYPSRDVTQELTELKVPQINTRKAQSIYHIMELDEICPSSIVPRKLLNKYRRHTIN